MSKLEIDITIRELNRGEEKIILFGETHGFIDDEVGHIEELIKIFRPNIILYELLEAEKLTTFNSKEKFLENPDNKRFSIISDYGSLKNVVKLAKRYNLPIEGCDLKNMGRSKPVTIKANPTKKELDFEERINNRREKYTLKFIKEAISKNKLCFVIIGAYHLRKESPLIKGLNKMIIVYPTYKGNTEFAPDQIKSQEDVIYIVEKLNHQRK